MKETNKLEATKANFPYYDILYLEHPTSQKHPRQPSLARAGQFSPFSALSGYEEQVKETSRLTNKKIILDEEEKEKINKELNKIIKSPENTEISITYFIKDNKKSGGKYENDIKVVKKIDTYNKKIIFTDNDIVSIEDIVNIEIINKQD